MYMFLLLTGKEICDKEWKVDLGHFTSKRYENEGERKRLPKQVRYASITSAFMIIITTVG